MINSLLTTDNQFNSTKKLLAWIEQRNRDVKVNVEQIPFARMTGWHIESDGNIVHDSGRFFSIQGIHVETDFGLIHSWDQPIIVQPEIGYLGIITKEINGILYFLMQSKIEPGNVNCVQISPTLQATKSNYTCVHNGNKPAYLDYFVNVKPEDVLLDQLQSEQGARFFRKRNRNIIIRVDEDIDILPDFQWMTLGQIKQLMQYNNMVNMDTRTVLSGIDFVNYLTPLSRLNSVSTFGKEMLRSAKAEEGLHSMDQLLSWLSCIKSKYDLSVTYKPIDKLQGWNRSETEIYSDNREYFRVIGVNVAIDNREVKQWCQPLVQPLQQGICAFIVKKINDVYHFLVQAKLECGNLDVMELAPTVQCLTGNVYRNIKKPPFVDYVLNARKEQILYDVLQSEEGGRFFREQNRNMLICVGDDFPVSVPEQYHWMTLRQIHNFLKFNNYLNIQSRSILSAIQYK